MSLAKDIVVERRMIYEEHLISILNKENIFKLKHVIQQT